MEDYTSSSSVLKALINANPVKSKNSKNARSRGEYKLLTR
jgi:hypothetical protein